VAVVPGPELVELSLWAMDLTGAYNCTSARDGDEPAMIGDNKVGQRVDRTARVEIGGNTVVGADSVVTRDLRPGCSRPATLCTWYGISQAIRPPMG